MKSVKFLLVVLGLFLFLSGCSNNHNLRIDFPQAMGDFGPGSYVVIEYFIDGAVITFATEEGNVVMHRRYIHDTPLYLTNSVLHSFSYADKNGHLIPFDLSGDQSEVTEIENWMRGVPE